jgi:hypothetical protein
MTEYETEDFVCAVVVVICRVRKLDCYNHL